MYASVDFLFSSFSTFQGSCYNLTEAGSATQRPTEPPSNMVLIPLVFLSAHLRFGLPVGDKALGAHLTEGNMVRHLPVFLGDHLRLAVRVGDRTRGTI